MTTSTMMRIASISKTFTATSILLLKDQGKIDLDKDISEYLGFTVRNPSYKSTPITVRMLASHTSSLNDGPHYDLFLSDSYLNQDPRPLMKDILSEDGKYYGL